MRIWSLDAEFPNGKPAMIAAAQVAGRGRAMKVLILMLLSANFAAAAVRAPAVAARAHRDASCGPDAAVSVRVEPTDFISFHAKGQPTVVDGHVRMGISNQLRTADQAFAKIAAVPELKYLPVVIGENDPEGCAACPGAQNAYRNGSLYASYTAASYARLWELARRRHVQLAGALTWAFTFVDQPWFAGYRQLATNGIDLPVLNVFRMFSRLGVDQVAATSSGEIDLERIESDGVRGSADVGVLATRTQQGRVQILLWHYHDDDLARPAAGIQLTVAGLAPAARYRARAWRVDPDHGNAFSAWVDMGSPANPSQSQIDRLSRSAQMTARYVPVQIRDDRATIIRRLPLQGVELIELEPMHP